MELELEQKQKQEYHHHRPMYEAESAWDLDIDEKTFPGGTYIPGYGTGLYHIIIIDADASKQASKQKKLDTALGGRTGM